MRSDTKTLIGALRSLASDDNFGDEMGVINLTLFEAADRLEELQKKPYSKIQGSKINYLLEKGYEIEETAVVIRKPRENTERGIVTEFGKVQWFKEEKAK